MAGDMGNREELQSVLQVRGVGPACAKKWGALLFFIRNSDTLTEGHEILPYYLITGLPVVIHPSFAQIGAKVPL